MKKIFISLVAVAMTFAFSSCASGNAADSENLQNTGIATDSAEEKTAESSTAGAIAEELASKKEAHSVDEVDQASAVDVILDGTTASSDSSAVSTNDGVVTITAGGTYRLSGTIEGEVVIAAPDEEKVAIILSDAHINSENGAALAVQSADEVTIRLADGTSNTLSDGSSYGGGEDEANSTLWSSSDLSITGNGALEVTGNNNDGIVSKDGLVIDSGTITVTAVDDGIRGKDYLWVSGADISVDAAGHALKSDNSDNETVGYVALMGGTQNLSSSGEDGINAQFIIASGADTTISSADDAMHADANMVLSSSVTITESYEGLEALNMTIDGGSYSIVSTDDGINIAGGDGSQAGGPGGGDMFAVTEGAELTIMDGEILINAEGDGLDSNGDVTLTGGSVTVHGPTNGGNGALDINGSFDITGGTLLAGGSAGMAETPDSSSAQGWVAAFVNASAGDKVELTDASGNILATYVPEKAVQSVVFSTSNVESGQTYSVLVNGSESGDVVANESNGMGNPGMGGRPEMGGNTRPGGANEDETRPAFGGGQTSGGGQSSGGGATSSDAISSNV